MGITLKEIAKMANVHRSTVDKVIHNRVGVSDEVREKIQAILDETGYKPNAFGQALQKHSSVIRIAVLLLRTYATDIINRLLPFNRTEGHPGKTDPGEGGWDHHSALCRQ